MKLTVPYYYNNFKCIANRCKDNCCIGWGIYIDDKTAEQYKLIDGAFGKRLKDNIDFENEQCFINDKNMRCPFLNKNNLCDIILNLGENRLCEICDRHPRFFEWFKDRIEGGIGLCCEEAARIIINSDNNFRLMEIEAPSSLYCDVFDDEYDNALFNFLITAREHIFNILCDQTISLEKALKIITAYAFKLQDLIDENNITATPLPDINECESYEIISSIKILINAEPIDENQPREIENIISEVTKKPDLIKINPQNENKLRNITLYFIYRYFMKGVFYGNLFPKIMLSIYVTNLINVIWNTLSDNTDENLIETARKISKIIEYSEDNIKLIYEYFYY